MKNFNMYNVNVRGKRGKRKMSFICRNVKIFSLCPIFVVIFLHSSVIFHSITLYIYIYCIYIIYILYIFYIYVYMDLFSGYNYMVTSDKGI